MDRDYEIYCIYVIPYPYGEIYEATSCSSMILPSSVAAHTSLESGMLRLIDLMEVRQASIRPSKDNK